MKCVILVAGRGTRMGVLTDNCPKPMLEVGGRPKLAYSLEALPAEIDEVILIVGYLGEQIREYFGDEFAGKRICYIAQTELNGTGGAIGLVANLIKGKFLVLMGDDLYRREDLERLAQFDLALLAMRTERAEQFGLVDVDEAGNLRKVLERPHGQKAGLINVGAYALSRQYFDFAPVAISDTEYGLPQTLVTGAEKLNLPVKIVEATDWLPIGNPEDLELAQGRIGDFVV